MTSRSLAVPILAVCGCHAAGNIFTSYDALGGDSRIGPVASEYVWAHGYGTKASDQAVGLIPMSDGGAILAADMAGDQSEYDTTVDSVNLGGADLPVTSTGAVVFARYDASGKEVWSNAYSG